MTEVLLQTTMPAPNENLTYLGAVVVGIIVATTFLIKVLTFIPAVSGFFSGGEKKESGAPIGCPITSNPTVMIQGIMKEVPKDFELRMQQVEAAIKLETARYENIMGRLDDINRTLAVLVDREDRDHHHKT